MEPIHYTIFGLLIVFLFALAITAYIVKQMPKVEDFESHKIRFAAATFTGILVLVLITAILGIVDNTGRGAEIFEKMLTSLSPIAGGIIGYLFSSRNK